MFHRGSLMLRLTRCHSVLVQLDLSLAEQQPRALTQLSPLRSRPPPFHLALSHTGYSQLGFLFLRRYHSLSKGKFFFFAIDEFL